MYFAKGQSPEPPIRNEREKPRRPEDARHEAEWDARVRRSLARIYAQYDEMLANLAKK